MKQTDFNSKFYIVKVTYGKGVKPHKSKHEESDKAAALAQSVRFNPHAFMKANNITVTEITQEQYYTNS